MKLKTSSALVHRYSTLVDGGTSVTLYYPASETDKTMKLIKLQGQLVDVEYTIPYFEDIKQDEES